MTQNEWQISLCPLMPVLPILIIPLHPVLLLIGNLTEAWSGIILKYFKSMYSLTRKVFFFYNLDEVSLVQTTLLQKQLQGTTLVPTVIRGHYGFSFSTSTKCQKKAKFITCRRFIFKRDISTNRLKNVQL
jgi:hypothetical protein